MKAFRIPEPEVFISEFQAGKQKYFTAGRELLLSQLDYEILATKSGFYKLPRLEKQLKLDKYAECIELVKEHYAKGDK
ncbi:hypothetical protein P7H75_06175 [Vagococcus carniphilus]|uniref:hypothetical protein n=1 Tax=Vagococcus carniphilus TaxID=218144 RepID=UPI00288EC0A5|nr:hypothetical protein [Vagococcus carniphilus]MDT2814427.1 hypothetical protein [Vagococcus carniphilus]